MQIPIVTSLPLQKQLEAARQTLAYHVEYAKESFSNELWQAMEHRGLNQVQFAAKADVTKQFLTRVFRGSNCTLETMVRLSEALGYHLNVHLTPSEYECDWLHYMPQEPVRPEQPYAKLWAAQDYCDVPAQKAELKNETVPAAA